jgi:flagellar protein FliO/FliZ
MDGSTIALFMRLIMSLAIVIGLMWAAAHVLRRRGLAPAGRRSQRNLQVELLARKALARNASIAVVRVAGRSMIVGVTDHNITKLDDADIEEIELEDAGANWTTPQGPTGPVPTWKTMLDQWRSRTVRH